MLVNIKKDFTPDTNFWELNPQLIIMNPFAKLYDADKTKDKRKSSIQMWTVFFMCDPDEQVNKFYRRPFAERKQTLIETYSKDVDWEEENFVECMDMYPHLCLSAIERALKEEVDSTVERARFLKEQKYSLDRTQIIGAVKEEDEEGNVVYIGGKSVTIKGTATQLDAMRKATPAIYDNYEKLKEKFDKSKMTVQLKAGRAESKSETHEI